MMPAAHLAPPSPSQNSSGLQGPFLLSPETWSPSFARHSAESAEKSPEQAARGSCFLRLLKGFSGSEPTSLQNSQARPSDVPNAHLPSNTPVCRQPRRPLLSAPPGKEPESTSMSCCYASSCRLRR